MTIETTILDLCEECVKHFSYCTCAKYAWLNDMAIESARRTIAFAECPPWDGSSLVAERISLASKLGHQKAADEMRAQRLVYGAPDPQRVITETKAAETRAWLEANCTPEELAELDRDLTPAELAKEMARYEAQEKAAHAILGESQFGDRRWTKQTWSYIDLLLGADKAVIIRAIRARKEASDKYYADFNRKMRQQFEAKYARG